ncbi:MAG: hypothetical protein LW700_01615 [Gemmataceae bacterium]|nr:hypothetical protein [Gemmataceae bacterium]
MVNITLNFSQPPLTGGINATSSPSLTKSSNRANAPLTAKFEHRSHGSSQGYSLSMLDLNSPTVAPDETITSKEGSLASSFILANKRTLIFIASFQPASTLENPGGDIHRQQQ